MTPSRRTLLLSALSPVLKTLKGEQSIAFALLGDRYHNIDHYRTALGKTLVREHGLTIDFNDETTLLRPDHLGKYKLLIVLRDGMIWPNGHGNASSNAGWWSSKSPDVVSDPPVPKLDAKPVAWMTAAQGKAVRGFVEGGGAALLYHNVTNIATYNDDFKHVLGGVYAGHPPIRRFKLKITNPDHPIARGVKDFVVTDEQHYMEYSKDRKDVFMESVNEEKLDYRGMGPTCPAGWAHELGKGRVCYLAPGHLIDDMWNPEYEKMQKNAVRWLLRQS